MTHILAALLLALFVTTARAGVGDPLRGLTADQQAAFAAGQEAFENEEDAAEGLGPVFNGSSCVACHDQGATGGGNALFAFETRFGTTTDGVFDPLEGQGGSLIQFDGIGPVTGPTGVTCDFAGEVVPANANTVALRRSTPLFGLGLVDAIPDSALRRDARLQQRFFPETAGRANEIIDIATGETKVGRFGWKAQVASLLTFSGDAYVFELGVTTSMFPDEQCPNGDCQQIEDCDPLPGIDDPELDDVEAFRDFMLLLAPAPQLRPTIRTVVGKLIFINIGCANCHTLKQRTGLVRAAGDAGDAGITPALFGVPRPPVPGDPGDGTIDPVFSFRTFAPGSDFLVHDMGSLGDGIVQGDVSGTEMRTAPLWGLRFISSDPTDPTAARNLLHDGRAATVEEAILAHAGQGQRARDRFERLGPLRTAALLAFVEGF